MATATLTPPAQEQSSTAQAIERVLIGGDLAKLTAEQRLEYYAQVCRSLDLNPLTRPLEYIVLSGKLTLYARKDATEQLRHKHGVSITDLHYQYSDDLVIVTATARDSAGRVDSDVGAVAIGSLKGEARANALKKCVCVPLDSEILTRDGFKRYDMLTTGEDVLAYDVAQDRCVWTPLRQVTVHDTLPMGRLVSAGGQFDARCTPDHSWAVRRTAAYRPDDRGDGSRGPRGPYATRGPQRRLVEAQQIRTSDGLILAAPEPGPTDDQSLLSPVEAAVLGWAVTDGTIQQRGGFRRMVIYQSKEENLPALRDLVGVVAPGTPEVRTAPRSRTFPVSGLTYETREGHAWYIPAAVTRAILDHAGYHDRSDLPRIVMGLSSAARKAMLQAFMLAEGDERSRFYNTDRSILDSFQILCALEGIATGRETHRTSAISQTLKKTRHVAGSLLRLEHLPAEAAWCPTTDLGTWVMRQGGRVMITGNTQAKRRVTLSICGLGMLDETEVESIPGAVHVEERAGALREVPPTAEGAEVLTEEQAEMLVLREELAQWFARYPDTKRAADALLAQQGKTRHGDNRVREMVSRLRARAAKEDQRETLQAAESAVVDAIPPESRLASAVELGRRLLTTVAGRPHEQPTAGDMQAARALLTEIQAVAPLSGDEPASRLETFAVVPALFTRIMAENEQEHGQAQDTEDEADPKAVPF